MTTTGEPYQELDKGLETLLFELSSDINEDVSTLLKDPYLKKELLKYLNSISSIESKEYLSSIPPTPSADQSVENDRTLVQDIAELEALQRSIDSQLKGLVYASKDEIISNQRELVSAETLFQENFVNGFKDLWRGFNEDELVNIENNEDNYGVDFSSLLELESNDQQRPKKNSLKSTLSAIRENSSTYSQNKSLATVLENMDQITNFLELPSLTGACIKAGYYSEALEVASYTRRLAIKFPQSELVKKVEFGIQQEMSHMLNGLMRLLKTDMKQSSLIKTLSYLRRIPPFSHSDDNSNGKLKRILLHARFQFIQGELDSLENFIEDENYEKHLKRSIEVIREYCFSSIMTFKNVFPDADPTELQDVLIEVESDGTAEVVVEEKPEVKDATEEVEVKTDEDSTETKDEETTNKPNTDENEEIQDKTEVEEDKIDEPKEEPKEKDENIAIISQSVRSPSNILIFEFVENVVKALLKELSKSLPNIIEISTRDASYLQLVYCAQSLNRIDPNFSDLMTATLLNAKINDSEYLIERKAWISSKSKQIQLSRNLNS